jgi:RNA polymerase sigma-70 factor (ECF subfamily)
MPLDSTGTDRAAETAEEVRLISGAKHGDHRCFEVLVERYMGPAIQVALGYVRNRDDAADLAQEAFYKVFRSLGSFRDGEPFAPWFFKILRNACLTFLERRKKRRAWSIHGSEDDDRPDFEPADGQGLCPRERAEMAEVERAFWDALETLSDRHREIVLLRHVQDLDYAQIAEVLDIPIGTVMSRLFHARQRLRVALREFMEGHE